MDVCIDTCMDLCIDMCMDMYVNTCMHIRVDMCVNMCVDMDMDVCIDKHIEKCIVGMFQPRLGRTMGRSHHVCKNRKRQRPKSYKRHSTDLAS